MNDEIKTIYLVLCIPHKEIPEGEASDWFAGYFKDHKDDIYDEIGDGGEIDENIVDILNLKWDYDYFTDVINTATDNEIKTIFTVDEDKTLTNYDHFKHTSNSEFFEYQVAVNVNMLKLNELFEDIAKDDDLYRL